MQVAPEVLYRVIWLTSNPHQSLRKGLTIKPAILHSYCRHQVANADYPGIIPQEGKSVLGTCVAGLTDQNIRNLDFFEGDQYQREKVKVRLLDGVKVMELGGTEGKEVEAETYVFTAKDHLVEEEWDFHEFVREKLWRWADLSEEYAGEIDCRSSKSAEDMLT